MIASKKGALNAVRTESMEEMILGLPNYIVKEKNRRKDLEMFEAIMLRNGLSI